MPWKVNNVSEIRGGGGLRTFCCGVSRALAIPRPRELIELYLFKDQASYNRYVAQYFPDIPYRRALFVKNSGDRGRVFVFRSEEMPTDVRHECTHAILHASLPMVPLWLDEGLAEYFEVPLRQRAFNNPHHNALIWRFRFGKVSRLADLEEMRSLADMGGTEYRNAWGWAHFLLHGPPVAHRQLVSFMGDIAAHTPPGKLSDRLERILPDLEDHLVEHFKTFKR